MPHFCLYDHPQFGLVNAKVTKRREDTTKDGLRLRYIVELDEAGQNNADNVITMLDDAMGKRCKAHGFYQAKYEDVYAVYKDLLDASIRENTPLDTGLLRAAALMLGVALTGAMCFLLPMVILAWLIICAFKSQSGMLTAAESAVVWTIFDWRPLIHKLFAYSQDGKWPQYTPP